MGKDQFVRLACADRDIPYVNIKIPENANLNQISAAVISALETEYAKEE